MPRILLAGVATLCIACADIGGRDPADPGTALADAGAGEPDREDSPPSVIPRPDGGTVATDPDGGPAAGPDGVHPTIRSTYALDEEWVYLEWDIVEAVTEYTLFAVTDDGPYVVKVEAGASDRGDFLYTYFHRDVICATFENAAAAAGAHAVWTQVWPGDDSSRAQSADTSGTITCP